VTVLVGVVAWWIVARNLLDGLVTEVGTRDDIRVRRMAPVIVLRVPCGRPGVTITGGGVVLAFVVVGHDGGR
jgi:hypothetical protein